MKAAFNFFIVFLFSCMGIVLTSQETPSKRPQVLQQEMYYEMEQIEYQQEMESIKRAQDSVAKQGLDSLVETFEKVNRNLEYLKLKTQ